MTSAQGIVGEEGQRSIPYLLKMLFKVEKERENHPGFFLTTSTFQAFATVRID